MFICFELVFITASLQLLDQSPPKEYLNFVITENHKRVNMLCRALTSIVLICAIPSIYSYSAGAPDGACGDMTPQHHVEV